MLILKINSEHKIRTTCTPKVNDVTHRRLKMKTYFIRKINNSSNFGRVHTIRQLNNPSLYTINTMEAVK